MREHGPAAGDDDVSPSRRAFLRNVVAASALLGAGTAGAGEVAAQTDGATFTVTDLSPTVVETRPGGEIRVTTTVRNTGTVYGSQLIEARLAGSVVSTQRVDLAADASRQVAFRLPVPDVTDRRRFTFSVASEDSSAEGVVLVVPDNPVFSVSNLRPQTATVEPGEEVPISATVTNTGSGTGTAQVRLLLDTIDAGSQEVTLDSGESVSVEFSIPAPEIDDERTFTHAIRTPDDAVEGQLTVVPPDPAQFTVEEIRPQSLSVEPEQRIDALVGTIVNTGGQQGERQIELVIGAETVERRSIRLSPNESTTVRFTDLRAPADPGTYSYEIRTGDDSALAQFRVTEPPTPPTSDGGTGDSGSEQGGSDASADPGQILSSLPVDPTSPPVAVALASGGAATLIGGYALLSGGSSSERPEESASAGGVPSGAGPTDPQGASAGAVEQSVSEAELADRIEEIDRLLDNAEVQLEDGDDERALDTCSHARSLLEETRADAGERYPDIVAMANDRFEWLRRLETDIEVAGGNVAPLLEREVPALASLTRLSNTDGLSVLRGTHTNAPGDARVYALADADDDAADAFTNAVSKWYNGHTHPNVVSIYDRDSRPQPWVAVEDFSGTRTVADLAGTDPEGVVAAVTDAAEAIRRMELYNVRHEDLTPDVVHVLEGGEGPQGVVDDWGLRRAVVEARGDERITAYTAPELLSAEFDSAAGTVDIYGLGAVAYYGLTGEPPVAAERSAILDGEITPPSSVADLPASVDDPVMRALETDPGARYDSAYDFSQALRSSLDR
ncbi:hypothetical protein GRX03_13835 [Halovenus sp. WSH3]|uniref:Protein kinase domain-containing protein n=1 Tax=Halovenus carboxidivorans TaxID=2692199 RepID=A0A6B0TBS2_9EURY|nr:CARDB domain-containing protein [Halovenus carboxidivorans]MXR52681.1 hypothetical protein [Halovenus carboxidivorans]